MKVAIVGGRSFGKAVADVLQGSGHEVKLVWSQDYEDPLVRWAAARGIAWCTENQPADWLSHRADLLVSAHNHRWLRPEQIAAFPRGAIGYHPSLLPRHRGRDAIEWTIRMGDPIAGGTVYKLEDVNGADSGPILAQDWCHVVPGWTASDLWREKLFGMGLRLLDDAVNSMEALGPEWKGGMQDERVATWEPAIDRPRLGGPE